MISICKPWEFNSRPRDVVWVFKKGYITDHLIVAWRDDGVVLVNKTGYFSLTYGELMGSWEQRDGSPCGIISEVMTQTEMDEEWINRELDALLAKRPNTSIDNDMENIREGMRTALAKGRSETK